MRWLRSTGRSRTGTWFDGCMCGSATGDYVAVDSKQSVPSPCRCRRRGDRRRSWLHNAEAHHNAAFGFGSDRSNRVALGDEITPSSAACEHARLVADGSPPHLGRPSSTGGTTLDSLRGSPCPLWSRGDSECACSSSSASWLDTHGRLRDFGCRGGPRSKWVLKRMRQRQYLARIPCQRTVRPQQSPRFPAAKLNQIFQL